MSRRPAILAVDAGGSKTDVALLRRDGTLLGAARVHSHEIDGRTWLMQPQIEERHLVPVGVAIEEAARQAGIDADRLPIADLGVYCLAGADLPADDRRLLRWLRSNGWTETEVLRNDTFAVLRAGTDRPWGVGVVCGYGTNCSAVAPDGRITRFPAIGPISGDWGGGGDLGGLAAWHAVRSEDGRGRKTALERARAGAFRIETAEAAHGGHLLRAHRRAATGGGRTLSCSRWRARATPWRVRWSSAKPTRS